MSAAWSTDCRVRSLCHFSNSLSSVDPPFAFLMTLFVPVSVARPIDAGPEAEDALVGLETCSTEALELLGRAKDTLSSIGEKMFPEERAQLSSLPSILELFASIEDPIDEFSRVQMMAEAEAMLTLAMGHGVPADNLEKITGEFPRDAHGNEVDLSIFTHDAERLAGRVFRLLAADAAGSASVMP